MAGEDRSAAGPVTGGGGAAGAAASDADFFHLVRRLECANPNLPRVGTSVRAREDPVRFGQHATLNFAPAVIAAAAGTAAAGTAAAGTAAAGTAAAGIAADVTAAVTDGSADADAPGPAGLPAPADIRVNFMGLVGNDGPMPLCLTEFIIERARDLQDTALADFLDVFHHRMVSLFYRAWALNNQAVSYDRPADRDGGRDRFATYVASLIGLGFDTLRDRDAVPDAAKLHYAPRLGPQTRNAEGLAAVLSDFFGIPARVEEFTGGWVPVPPESRCALGGSPEAAKLGHGLVLGARAWQWQHRFRIVLGPMGREDYDRMLPGGTSFRRLRDWVLTYVGYELCWDTRLVLRKAEVPPARVGQSDSRGEGGRTGDGRPGGVQLGYSTWLGSRPFPRDADDLVVDSDGRE